MLGADWRSSVNCFAYHHHLLTLSVPVVCLYSGHLAVIANCVTNVVQEVLSSECATLLFPTSHPPAFLLPHRILITTQRSPLYPSCSVLI